MGGGRENRKQRLKERITEFRVTESRENKLKEDRSRNKVRENLRLKT